MFIITPPLLLPSFLHCCSTIMESLLEWVNTFSVVSQRLVRCSNISQLADPALLAAILGEMYFHLFTSQTQSFTVLYSGDALS